MDTQSWHIGKEIPLTLICGILIQTVFFAVWLANLSSSVGVLTAALVEFKADRYTGQDARRDRELMEQKILFIQQSSTDHLRRTADIEATMKQLERRR